MVTPTPAAPTIPAVEVTANSLKAGEALTGRERAGFFAQALMRVIDNRDVTLIFMALNVLIESELGNFRDEIQKAFAANPPANANLSYFTRVIELASSVSKGRIGEILKEWPALALVEPRLVRTPLPMGPFDEGKITMTLRGLVLEASSHDQRARARRERAANPAPILWES
jgi:hypothetical protein